MADTIIDPAQSAPAAATLTTLYTVPASTTTVVSTITICNRSATADTVRVAIRIGGAAIANSHYLIFDESIEGNSHRTLTLGIGLAATTIISVLSTNGTSTFHAYLIQRT